MTSPRCRPLRSTTFGDSLIANLNPSANKLEALLNEVRAQSGKHVSESAANTLQLAIEAMLAK